jgi:hypothetical protein
MSGEADHLGRIDPEILTSQQEHMRCGAFRVLVEPLVGDALRGEQLANFVRRACRGDDSIDALHGDVARLYGIPQRRTETPS